MEDKLVCIISQVYYSVVLMAGGRADSNRVRGLGTKGDSIPPLEGRKEGRSYCFLCLQNPTK